MCNSALNDAFHALDQVTSLTSLVPSSEKVSLEIYRPGAMVIPPKPVETLRAVEGNILLQKTREVSENEVEDTQTPETGTRSTWQKIKMSLGKVLGKKIIVPETQKPPIKLKEQQEQVANKVRSAESAAILQSYHQRLGEGKNKLRELEEIIGGHTDTVNRRYEKLKFSHSPVPQEIQARYDTFQRGLEQVKKFGERIQQELDYLEEALGFDNDIPKMEENELQDPKIAELETKYKKLVAQLERKQILRNEPTKQYNRTYETLDTDIEELNEEIRKIILARQERLDKIHSHGGDEEYQKYTDIAYIKHAREEENFKDTMKLKASQSRENANITEPEDSFLASLETEYRGLIKDLEAKKALYTRPQSLETHKALEMQIHELKEKIKKVLAQKRARRENLTGNKIWEEDGDSLTEINKLVRARVEEARELALKEKEQKKAA